MGWGDILAILILILAVALGYYYLFGGNQNLLSSSYESNLIQNLSSTSGQFYPNLRFSKSTISYEISSECDSSRRESVLEAMQIISSETILNFIPKDNGELRILCSNSAPEPKDKKHFIAGEGGPILIINASQYYVIEDAQISLYKDEKCEVPVIAIHELLHALGFDHISRKSSILYPISECDQKIDNEIINTINEVYSVPSAPDLSISSLQANKSGRYMDFEIAIDNYGIADSFNSTLEVISEGKVIDTFFLQELGYGKRKLFSVSNLAVPRDSEVFIFEISDLGKVSELSLSNNKAEISLTEDKSKL